MNFTALTLAGAGLVSAQPPGPDYQAYRTRALRFDFELEPDQKAKVRQVELHASDDQGGVWNVEATVKPDQTFLPFTPKKDGVYWIKIVTVFANGSTEPADVANAPPFQKLLVDATPPAVRVTSAARSGDEVAVSWSVEERHPNDARTKVEYLSGGVWKTVPVTGVDKRSTRFRPPGTDAVQVRVTVEDLAGNTGFNVQDVPGERTTAFAPPAAPKPLVAAEPLVMPGLVPPPSLTPDPAVQPAAVPPPAPVMNLTPPESPPAAPIASGTGVTAAGPTRDEPRPGPVSELPPPQVVNFTRFDLPYQLDAGPSGVSRIDLYVTRDDGRSWTKWSEHDGKQSPLRVDLDARTDAQKEGVYGFRLVPVSGAGLREDAPSAGSPPDFRLEIDLTPPLVQVFPPEADPAQRDILVLKWAVKDRGRVKDTVALEWADAPTGPWKPVAGGDAGVLAVGGVSGGAANQVPNSGRYAWRIPTGLTSHKVHIRITAWDAAGNASEVTTPPILVDLVKPRAKIQGVMPVTSKP